MRLDGKSKRSRRLRWPQILILLMSLPVLLFIWVDMNLKPVILSMAEAKARVMAVEAVNNAAYEVMRERVSYNDLMVVVMDEEGRVSMLQADTMRMNELGTRTALVAQRNLDALAATGIRIPIGAATGSRLLAGSGPSVTVNLVPMGSVRRGVYQRIYIGGHQSDAPPDLFENERRGTDGHSHRRGTGAGFGLCAHRGIHHCRSSSSHLHR